MGDNKRKILHDSLIQKDKLVLACQLDVLVNKNHNLALVINIAV